MSQFLLPLCWGPGNVETLLKGGVRTLQTTLQSHLIVCALLQDSLPHSTKHFRCSTFETCNKLWCELDWLVERQLVKFPWARNSTLNCSCRPSQHFALQLCHYCGCMWGIVKCFILTDLYIFEKIELSVSLPLSRLDYSGIALLIMGSFVPWLYYSFYCSPQPRLIYLTIVCVLGIAAIIVAQWDRFSTPRHRPTRAGTY